MNRPDEVILSRQNALVKLTASLTERKFREREGLFRFDGKKLFLEALDAELPLFAVLFKESAAEGLCALAGARRLPDGCRAVMLSDELFDRISEEKAPEGAICVSRYLDRFHKTVTVDHPSALEKALEKGHTLLLESVRDPGNLGTIIRSAAAFGVAQIVLSRDCADLYHSRVLRAAMGTLFHTRVIVTDDLAAAIAVLRGSGDVYAAALDAKAVRLGECAFGAQDAVVVGNEGHGLSQRVLDACSRKLYIPMAEGVESLNAGVAASVLLWELYRGR